MITVRELVEADRAWVRQFLAEEAGATRVVSRGKLHYPDTLPGFAALLDDNLVGLLNYRLDGLEMEVVTLYASIQRKGVGSALLEAAKASAVKAGCNRLWLITTNDNQPAIDFYTGRGMSLAAIHKDALSQSRKLKPEIPLYGLGGKAITDELEFEMLL
jgi:ribosomal protein S18 acetylase RimI-like enzyme